MSRAHKINQRQGKNVDNTLTFLVNNTSLCTKAEGPSKFQNDIGLKVYIFLELCLFFILE